MSRFDPETDADLHMIFVDESIFRYHGKLFCHMWTDGTVQELHTFATTIEVKRCWFESERKKGWNHYDLNQDQRARAVAAGAIEVDRFSALEHVLKRKGVWTPEHEAKWERLRNGTAEASGSHPIGSSGPGADSGPVPTEQPPEPGDHDRRELVHGRTLRV